MIAYAHRIEDRVKSDLAEGVEYDGNAFALRLRDMRLYNGAARVYFDESGTQVSRGVQFSPISEMDRRPFNIRRPWETYRVLTNLEFTKPVPNGYKIQIEPYEEIGDVGFMFLTKTLPAGFTGRVSVIVVVTRRAVLDENIIFARAQLVADWEQPPSLHESDSGAEEQKYTGSKKTGKKSTTTSASTTSKGESTNENSKSKQSGNS